VNWKVEAEKKRARRRALTKPMTIGCGDPIGIVAPVLLPKQFTLEELKPRG